MTYASEMWVLKETIIQKLLVFERKTLRRISGPMKENQIWRIKTNTELDKLIKHKNIVNHIQTSNSEKASRSAVQYKNIKRYVSTTNYIYYHIGVKMDNMFQPSSGHHQVQYKEMWGSTELRTRMGSH